MIHLRSEVRDFNFMCPNCDHDLSNVYIKNRFIWGIANDMLQVDMLAKAGSLNILEQNANSAEALEMAIREQNDASQT